MFADGFLDSIVRLFSASAADLVQVTAPLALSLFVTLATIQVAWDLMMWTLRDEPNIVGLALRRFLILSFFYVLIAGFPLWMPQILQGFETLGQRATGLDGLSPSSLFLQGVALAMVSYRAWSQVLVTLVPVVGVLQVVTFFSIVIAFSVMAFRLAGILVEGALVLGGLMITLAGAGHRVTFGLAEGYIRYAFDVGLRIFIIYILTWVGRDLGLQWLTNVRDASLFELADPRFHLAIPASAVFFAYVVWTLPKTISGRILEPFSFSGHNPLADR